MGTPKQLQKLKESRIAYDLFLYGSILIMALYHLGLFSLRRKERSTLYFGLFCLIIALRILLTGDRYLLQLFPGIGINSKDLGRIFHPFEQVDQTTTRRFQGTGLGLSLSKRFVELHNGEIWAESPGVGMGSSFHFTIPITQVPIESTRQYPSQGASGDASENAVFLDIKSSLN